MMERTTSHVARQSRTSGTQTLVEPRADLFAGEIVEAIRQGHYDQVAATIGKMNDANELLAVRQVLHGKGLPFDAVIPAGEVATHKAIRNVLKHSTVQAQARFADSLSLIELEAIGRFDLV